MKTHQNHQASEKLKSNQEIPETKIKILAHKIASWYLQNKRTLPWRMSQDPYRIWISEVMLQQTTVAAVVPFYDRFLARFPNVKSLAAAPLDEVLSLWAGLGYYSRARLLHRSAQVFNETGFPKSYQKLLDLPGFGPYTSRAVASLAFEEATGVLDGNVIRILTRVFGLTAKWWLPSERAYLQNISDQFANHGKPSQINQGLMELGATVCTPTKPTCLLCPWQKQCVARAQQKIEELPAKKPRRQQEIWVWTPQILFKGDKVLVELNQTAPFLKNQFLFPGEIKKQTKKPKHFHARHCITHHNIFIRLTGSVPSSPQQGKLSPERKWVRRGDLKKVNPSSLLQKVLLAHQGLT